MISWKLVDLSKVPMGESSILVAGSETFLELCAPISEEVYGVDISEEIDTVGKDAHTFM